MDNVTHRTADHDMHKGAKEEERPGPERSSHPGLDKNGLPNDPVAIAFSQHIGAGDALRTGTYSATLTFTLSTTSP